MKGGGWAELFSLLAGWPAGQEVTVVGIEPVRSEKGIYKQLSALLRFTQERIERVAFE
jgi:hypothetical protein